MAINQLQLPSYAAPQTIDFQSPLAAMGQQYQKAQKEAALKGLFANADTSDPQSLSALASRAFSIDPAVGMSLSQLATSANNTQYQRGRDQTLDARHAAERADTNAYRERGFRIQEDTARRAANPTPAGFQRTPQGLVPEAGGPADPAYIQKTNEAKAKPRLMSIGDITKLSEEGGKFSQVSGFADTFKPEFGGYKAKWVGELANTAGRNLPESMVGKPVAEGANWWQSYDAYKGVVRNDLYGSALTAPEIKSFEAADITPGMDPGMIQRNLKRQTDIIKGAVTRKANAMIESGYDPEAVGKAYGLDMGKMGVSPKGQKPAPPPPPQAVEALRGRPDLAAQFDAKYGPGASARLLGGQ